jgi:hypothetical protein
MDRESRRAAIVGRIMAKISHRMVQKLAKSFQVFSESRDMWKSRPFMAGESE